METNVVTIEQQPKKAKSRKGITAYQTKDGTRYLAQVRLAGRKPMSKSFDSFKDADAWKKAQEVDAARGKKQSSAPTKLTMGDQLDAKGEVVAKGIFTLYTEESARHGTVLPDHQLMMFARLNVHPLLKDVKVSAICFSVVRDYCAARITVDGVAPSTLQAEYARISVSIERCADWLNWGENFVHPLAGARKKLMKAKLIADSEQRDRRPSREEMTKIVGYFKANSSATSMPMADITEFAALNAFRRGEIPALRWCDLDVEASTIVVWRKDSSVKGGKRKCLTPILPAALAIIMRQPRDPRVECIFPYVADTIGGAFSDACKKLGIEDLRFHDLRHEAITTAAQVLGDTEGMQLSGHKSHRHYKRYVNFQKEDISRIAAKLSGIKSAVAA